MVEVPVGHEQIHVLDHAVLEHRPDLVRVRQPHLHHDTSRQGRRVRNAVQQEG